MDNKLIEIIVDGLPVSVDEAEYLADPDATEDLVRKNRIAVRYSEDADHDAADTILGVVN